MVRKLAVSSQASLKTWLFATALLQTLPYYGNHLALTNLEIYFQEPLTSMESLNTLSRETYIVISPSLAANRCLYCLNHRSTQHHLPSPRGQVRLVSPYLSYLHPYLPMFFLLNSHSP